MVRRDEVEGALPPCRAMPARPSIELALASAAIISPFQSASTLSSRPGRTRVSRAARSFARKAGEPRFVVVAARQAA